jgi:hypothetical protein
MIGLTRRDSSRRTGALLALETLKAGVTVTGAVEPVRMTEARSRRSVEANSVRRKESL